MNRKHAIAPSPPTCPAWCSSCGLRRISRCSPMPAKAACCCWSCTRSRSAPTRPCLPEMIEADDRARLEAALLRSRRDNSTVNWDGRIRFASGEIKWINMRAAPRQRRSRRAPVGRHHVQCHPQQADRGRTARFARAVAGTAVAPRARPRGRTRAYRQGYPRRAGWQPGGDQDRGIVARSEAGIRPAGAARHGFGRLHS